MQYSYIDTSYTELVIYDIYCNTVYIYLYISINNIMYIYMHLDINSGYFNKQYSRPWWISPMSNNNQHQSALISNAVSKKSEET